MLLFALVPERVRTRSSRPTEDRHDLRPRGRPRGGSGRRPLHARAGDVRALPHRPRGRARPSEGGVGHEREGGPQRVGGRGTRVPGARADHVRRRRRRRDRGARLHGRRDRGRLRPRRSPRTARGRFRTRGARRRPGNARSIWPRSMELAAGAWPRVTRRFRTPRGRASSSSRRTRPGASASSPTPSRSGSSAGVAAWAPSASRATARSSRS